MTRRHPEGYDFSDDEDDEEEEEFHYPGFSSVETMRPP